MKAQRRHQLQANELARQLETFPETLKRNASTILLMITACVVVFFVVRYRRAAAENRQINLSNALMSARQGPQILRSADAWRLQAPIEQVVGKRNQLISETRSAIDTILRDAEGDDERALRAEALVAKGDLNWSLANLKPVPEAATQPALALARTSLEYLKDAEDAYTDVVNGYAGQIVSWVSAQMGLAAIAENRGDWADAGKHYQAVLDRKSDVPEGFARLAAQRLNQLAILQKPIYLGDYPPKPTTAPSSGPAVAAEPTTSGVSASAGASAAAASATLPPATAPVSTSTQPAR
jgi:hypothetical protein